MSHVSKKFPLLSIFSIFFVSPKVLRSFPKVLKLNSEEIQKRIDNRGKTKHPDYVDFMLPPDATPPTTKKQKVHLEQVAFQLFIAGYDPIQITLNSVIFFLLKEPKIYAKLVEEIRGAFQDYDDINSDALVDLKFLHACVQETLRVHVTTITGLPRISPGAEVDGVYVPEGVSKLYYPPPGLSISRANYHRSCVKLAPSLPPEILVTSVTLPISAHSAGSLPITQSTIRATLMIISRASTHLE